MIVVISGVSGTGKSTIGRKVAERLGWRFYDGDDFHSQSNVDKMTRGEPLTDADRAPWLQAMARAIKHWHEQGDNAILACSALKHAYRTTLFSKLPVNNTILRADSPPQWQLVYLKAPPSVILARLNQRQGHFMKPAMLQSQLNALEEPATEDAIIVDATLTIEEIVSSLSARLRQMCKQ